MKINFPRGLVAPLIIGGLLIVLGGVWGIPVMLKPAGEAASGTTKAGSNYDRYDYGVADSSKIVDLGTVSSSMQVGFVTQCLLHDRVLQQQLARSGWQLREHAYPTGAEMTPYLDGRLDVMTLGDIPSLSITAEKNHGIFLTTSISTMTFVANRRLTPRDLKGLKLGLINGTVTHFGAYRALLMGGLSLEDANLVQVLPAKFETAMRDGNIDGGGIYEPFTTSILNNLPQSAVISRYDVYTFMCMNLDFAKRHPDQAQAIMAAVYRASRWAAQSDDHLRQVLQWIREAQVAALGSSLIEPKEPWLSLIRKDTVENPSYPMLPLDFGTGTSLQHQQFDFLKKVGLVVEAADWLDLTSRVEMDLLPRIITQGQLWEINRFDYGTDISAQGQR